MVILATNVTDESLNNKTITKSFEISENYTGKRDIKEIIFFKAKEKKKLWELTNNIPIKEYKIAMDEKTNDIYEGIANVLDPIFNKGDYIQVIVDTSILGFYILDVIKKFNVGEVFIAKDGELDKFQTCICEI
ncbi:MAG: hypothetical protein LBU74_00525 [Methanobacteriaceae archaeon]|nr:hypothetical protein [Candidatus Methanorudis spinitermitis]